ncbi:unnamed protein product [Linum tenue]|uniref:Uncharacterized protein n=1 Tax=Linum tenue TaxID=586396 RepID=A0AAV0I2G5_9ROSI|nr:unnamed protein product [Linum tenue]
MGYFRHLAPGSLEANFHGERCRRRRCG